VKLRAPGGNVGERGEPVGSESAFKQTKKVLLHQGGVSLLSQAGVRLVMNPPFCSREKRRIKTGSHGTNHKDRRYDPLALTQCNEKKNFVKSTAALAKRDPHLDTRTGETVNGQANFGGERGKRRKRDEWQ